MRRRLATSTLSRWSSAAAAEVIFYLRLPRPRVFFFTAARPLFAEFKRQRDDKFAAGALYAAHRYAAAHEFRKVPGYRQPQPGAAVSRGGSGVFLFERIEDFRNKFLFYADPRVVDGEAHVGFAGGYPVLADRKPHAASRRSEFYRVGDDIYQYLLEFNRVAKIAALCEGHHDAVVVDALRLRLFAADGIDAVDEFLKGDLFFLDDDFAAFDAAHVKYVVDKGQQEARRYPDFRQTIGDLFRVVHTLRGDRRHPYYRVHRRSDLMAHAREEFRLGEAGLLCLGERLSEHLLLPRLLVEDLGHIALRRQYKAPDVVKIAKLPFFPRFSAAFILHVEGAAEELLSFKFAQYIVQLHHPHGFLRSSL